ncbi:MAG: hypothetical protein CMN31_27465 [Sandaracinus sp.]|nr:hypothetical protein [Sandaracinus sp.]MBJ75029.1 hypothetical protein [Sandaracinus sp.]
MLAAVLTFARGVPRALMESWDDQRFLVEFEPVQAISLDNLVAIWSEPHFEAYHPLHLMAYWLDVPFAGPNGPVIHAVNLALFAGALLLVRRVLLGWGLGRLPALLATLAYGLHPVQVEAVTWATGRKEIVALALACAALLAHRRSAGAWDRWAWASRAAYLLAALAKTTVLPLPLVLLAEDVWLRERSLGEAVKHHALALVAGLGLAQVVVSIWEANEMVRPPPPGLGRVALVGATITHHLGTALLPLDTSPVYALHRELGDFSWLDAAGPLALALLFWRGGPRARFSAFAFAALLAPVMNFVPVYFEVQDRYLSLPLLPLAFGFGALLEKIGEAEPRRVLFGAPWVGLLAALTVLYQGAWESDEALWTHAAETHPGSFYAWMKVGEVHRNEGEYDSALAAYEHAIEAEPTLRLGHAGRFQALALRDEARLNLSPSQAIPLSQRYVQHADDAVALRTLAGDMVVAGYREAALMPLSRALDLEPLPPERLERAAVLQLEHDAEWLVRFYVSRLGRPPFDERLRPFMPE